MIRVEFIEVGRSKRSWEEEVPHMPSTEWLARRAKAKAPILSNDVDVELGLPSGGEILGTVFVGGLRDVGRVRIRVPADAQD